MESVESLVRQGVIPPLTQKVLQEEVDGLYEDLLNWNCGHPLKVAKVVGTVDD